MDWVFQVHALLTSEIEHKLCPRLSSLCAVHIKPFIFYQNEYSVVFVYLYETKITKP